MKCPFCSHTESKVIDSRASTSGDATRRRRECEGCGRRFTTYERIEEVLPVIVKKDGRRESFDRQKLMAGLRRACEKRPIPLEVLEGLVDSIERELMESGEREVFAPKVGEMVMARLKELDAVAYVRFASVYRSFKDLEDFREELEKIGSPKAGLATAAALAEGAPKGHGP